MIYQRLGLLTSLRDALLAMDGSHDPVCSSSERGETHGPLSSKVRFQNQVAFRLLLPNGQNGPIPVALIEYRP